MRHSLALAAIASLAPLAAAQTLTAIDNPSPTRSGRIVLTGTGFGAAQGSSRVVIAGLDAIVTTWTASRIHAYIPEAAAIGPATVQVFTTGPSNTLPLTISPRPASSSRTKWKFVADDPYLSTEPAVAADGTVYVIGAYSHLYALTPDGGLKWARSDAAAYRSPALAADGTVYCVTAGNLCTALSPTGTVLWNVPHPAGAGGVFLGPEVAPDGRIYGVCQVNTSLGTGFGLFAISPQGQILWNRVRAFDFRAAPVAFRMAFTPGKVHFITGNGDPLGDEPGLYTFSSDGDFLWLRFAIGHPGVDASNNVYAMGAINNNNVGSFTSDGAQRWLLSYNVLGSQPGSRLVTGSDGVSYMGTTLGPRFHRINPTGTLAWTVVTNPFDRDLPIIKPDNSLVLVQGYPLSSTPPIEIQAVNPANGSVLWSVPMDILPGGQRIAQFWEGAFSPDGSAAYIPTSGLNSATAWSYLYAIDTTASGPQPPCYANCDGSTTAPILNVNDFVCFQTRYAGGDPAANCDGSTIPPVLNVNDFVCFQQRYAAGCP